jgi:hypothetical protein
MVHGHRVKDREDRLLGVGQNLTLGDGVILRRVEPTRVVDNPPAVFVVEAGDIVVARRLSLTVVAASFGARPDS